MASKTMPPAKVDTSDPAVRRLVYNMYRGMLGGYNDQANCIIDALPAERVREDQGIHRQLESMIRQSSNSSGGTSPGAYAGDAPPAPAPPPPPPPAPGGFIPSMRINSEIADCRGRSPKPCAPGEPPAAIQNAMMTKDKKPFTYTPGGLDLSQIRSPRIQRRINRNINDEGVGAPQQQQQQERSPPHLSPAAQAAMQPNMHVQVLPAMPPPPPPPPPQSVGVAAPHPQLHPAAPAYAPPLGGAQAPVSAQAVQLTAANLRPTGIAPMRRDQHQPQQQNEPGSLYVAPVPVSATPAAPAAPRAQLGSLYIPPVDVVDSAGSPSSATPPPPPQRHFNPQSPQAGLNKAPTPWISSLHQQQAKQQPPSPQQLPPQQQCGSRIIPIQIEGREPPQPQPQVQLQQQRQMQPQSPQQDSNLAVWQQRQQQLRQQQGIPVANQQVPWRTVQSPTSPPPPSHQVPPGERVIPIQIEGATSASTASTASSASSPRHFQPQNSSEWGMGPPVQSQSFRVLQKITGTDRNDDDAPDASGSVPRNQQPGRQNDLNAAQLRKLQLNEDDRALMNKFKAQVDDEIYLHQESDPRYRGAAIPSRAFRMLQNMTGSDDGMAPLPSRISPAVRAAQQSVQESAAQPYIPPSEQTAPEPRKYTGGAIPSRSFRMLQAMTAGPGNCAMNPSANGRETPLSVSLQPVYDAYGAEYNPPPALPPAPDSSNPTGYWELQTPEQQQQFWEHYNAMCAYMAEMNAALGYGPVPFPAGCHYPYDPYSHWGYHASDSEDCSGYSSTDEMSYYGANFARNGHEFYPYSRHCAPQMPAPPSITVTPTTDPDTPTNEYQTASEEVKGDALIDSYKGGEKRFLTDVPEEDSADDDSSETDTEKEDSTAGKRHSGPGNALQTIKSVPNVHVYSDSGDAMDSMTSETDDQTEDDYDGEDDVVIAPYPQEDDYPHQLSVILEESEASDAESIRRGRQKAESSSVVESSTATTNSECDSEEDLGDVEESTVMVRLPLRLKFSRSENDEEVTTVIVGDSQVRRTSISSVESPDLEKVSNPLSVADQVSSSNDDVSITVTISSRASAAPSTPSERQGSLARDPSVGRPITADDAIAKPETGRQDGDLVRTEDDMGADVSVSVPVFRSRRQSTSVASPVENSSNTSEEEDRAKSNEESDYHWEDDSSSTSIQTVRGLAERAGAEHNSGSELEAAGTADELDDPVTLKKDPEGTEEAEEAEDFEWGEDGTLRTIKVPRRSLDAMTDSLDEEGCSEEAEHQFSATVSDHSDGVPSDEDDMSSASSSNSSSSSSSTSNSESSSGSASSRSRSNRSTSLSRDSTAAKCEVDATSQASSIIEAERESEVQKPSNSDDESCASTEVTEEESDDDGEELESDSKPEEVEKYVRTIMSNMKFMPVHASNDDVEPPVMVATVNENHLEPMKTDSPDIPESTTNDKIDTSKGESEEDDSGVTSDMSRHISEAENEETSESHKPRKVSKYQRAQTHSRLFRLLQDESICSQTNDSEENNEQSNNPGLEQQFDCPVGSLSSRKECLTLPLASNTISDPDSLSSSSGITSPASPTITDRLVKELVHTLLQRKKGRRLRKVPIAKLQAAALRILQEDMDPYDTLSSTSEEGSGHFFRSSVHSRVPPSNAADSDKSDKNVYGTNYLDYRNYYESWNTYYDEAGVDYDIMPSRAFKLLDQHAQPGGFSSGVIEGLWGKCPRERSSKTVNKDVSQNPTHDTPHDPSPQPNNTCTVASGREDK